jgi:hypothetical protein
VRDNQPERVLKDRLPRMPSSKTTTTIRRSRRDVEGTVNRLIGRRMCKSQQMCWTKRGAHLLLQVRCAVFNGDLLAGFQRWFPAVGSRRCPGIGCPSNRNGSYPAAQPLRRGPAAFSVAILSSSINFTNIVDKRILRMPATLYYPGIMTVTRLEWVVRHSGAFKVTV